MTKKRIVVICPGRGSYTQEELGYLKRNGEGIAPLISTLDQLRQADSQPTVTELDSHKKFSVRQHTVGENASILIHACAMADFASIDRDKFEVVAVTGNSMGWYLTLAAAEALDDAGAYRVINTMGSMMQDKIIGGQILYPIVDDAWHLDTEKVELIEQSMMTVNKHEDAEVHHSIRLGGYAVIGGNDVGLRKLTKLLTPIDDKYPLRLVNHAAFHTPLMNSTSEKAFDALGSDLFHAPKIPVIDGRGHIWQPYATDIDALRNYTLGHQVTECYDYSAAITVALKEFCPDHLVLLGPGSSLGGATAQVMINHHWRHVTDKSSFAEQQGSDPFLVAMGRADQRPLVI